MSTLLWALLLLVLRVNAERLQILRYFCLSLCYVTPTIALSISFYPSSAMAIHLVCTSLWRIICAHLFESPVHAVSSSSGSSVVRSSHFFVTLLDRYYDRGCL